MGVYRFGLSALVVILASVVTAIAAEWLYGLVTRSRNTVIDGSAAVTGLLLALTLPATVPIWQAVIGSAFAIIVIKSLCGGLGQNIFNPALSGRALLMSSVHPEVKYTASHALERNKCIYGLSGAAFVISCEKGRGAAWDGACSAMRNRYTEKVFVWDHPSLPGNRELIERGATAFTDPMQLPLHEMKRVWDTPAFEQMSLFDM